LPASAYSFGFTRGTIGNVHFLALPVNANARAGAQVVADLIEHRLFMHFPCPPTSKLAKSVGRCALRR